MVNKYKVHTFFLTGIIIFIVFAKILSLYIWNISFDGNYSYTNEELNSFLCSNHVKTGIMKSSADCEDIEYKLRTNFSEIAWVSAEINGTKLIIHIKENYDGVQVAQETKPYNIISDVDGVIDKVITRTGVPQIKSGDTVTKGQLLIKGIVDVIGDDQSIISSHLVKSDADIYAYIDIPFNESIPLKYIKKIYTGRKNKYIDIKAFTKSFYLTGISKKFKNYDISTNYNQLSMFNSFYLPFNINKVIVREYKLEEAVYTKTEAQNLAVDRLNKFMKNLSEKGIQIIQNNVTISCNENNCISSGYIKILRKIGTPEYISESDIETESTKQTDN